MKRTAELLMSAALVVAGVGCTKDDIGEPCHPRTQPPLPPETIGGEQPVVEIVSLERSNDCETFQCLTDRGYSPYCTRTCSYDMSAKAGPVCTSDSQCKRPQHCYQGRCRDDDCPPGFVCSAIQDVGPLAGKLYCVYKEGCGDGAVAGDPGKPNNSACENLGVMECRQMACFDSSLLATDPTAPHTLTCEPFNTLPFCQCPSSNPGCTDAEMRCDPDTGPAWPAGSVERRDVCMRTQ